MATSKKAGTRSTGGKPGKAAPASRAAKSAAVSRAAKSAAASRSPKPARPAAGAAGGDLALQHEVAQFLFRQSGLLDAKRWQEYIALFTADGMYWMPTAPHYTTWDGTPAIFVEDTDLMTVRMRRVQHPNAWSQQAEWSTSHVVSNVVIDRVENGGSDIHVSSRFHMLELRRDDLRNFAGTYRHHLRRTPGGLRIRMQRVDLLNAQAAWDYVLQVWV